MMNGGKKLKKQKIGSLKSFLFFLFYWGIIIFQNDIRKKISFLKMKFFNAGKIFIILKNEMLAVKKERKKQF